MFCFIYQWLISWALDSGKELPGAANRHLGRCSKCRELARLSGLLNTRLTQDAPGFLQKKHDTFEWLNIKITSALDTKTPMPFTRRWSFNSRPKLALAAATVVLVVLAAIIAVIFQVIPFTGPGKVQDSSITLESVTIKNPLQVIQKVESPMESEMRSLGNSVHSAAKFLVSCLDVKIGQGD